MARPTQQEIDEWEARMNEPEEPDPDDFEVVLFDNEGNPVGTMPYAKAKAHFKRRGIDLDDPVDNSSTDPNAAPSGAGPAKPVAPRASNRYFAGKGRQQPVAPNAAPPTDFDPQGNAVGR